MANIMSRKGRTTAEGPGYAVRIAVFFTGTLLLGMFSACTPENNERGDADMKPVSVLIEIERPGQSAILEAIRAALDENEAETLNAFQVLPVVSATVGPESLSRLLRVPGVVSISPDQELSTQNRPRGAFE